MKITVITGERGNIVAVFHGHAKDIRSEPGLYAVPVPGPDQKVHEIDVPEDVFPRDPSPSDLENLPERVKRHLRTGTGQGA